LLGQDGRRTRPAASIASRYLSGIFRSAKGLLHALPALPRRNGSNGAAVSAEDFWAVVRYLASRLRAGQRVPAEQFDALAGRFYLLAERDRCEVQVRLRRALDGTDSGLFLAALFLAARIPVPQARGRLLQLLTRRDVASWQPTGSARASGNASNGNVGSPAGLKNGSWDLRPAIIDALSQIGDPAFLGLFEHLLEKVSNGRADARIVSALNHAIYRLHERMAGAAGRDLASAAEATSGTNATSRGRAAVERELLLGDL